MFGGTLASGNFVLNPMRLLYRAWFYFRIGYSTYIAFFIGFASNIVVIYALAIKPNLVLLRYFDRLWVFALITLVVAVPISVLVGLFHMKRTGAFAADASVSLEANPYVYKVVPGKEQEVILPLMIATVRGIVKILQRENTLTDSERREFEDVLLKADRLLQGQVFGRPQRAESP